MMISCNLRKLDTSNSCIGNIPFHRVEFVDGVTTDSLQPLRMHKLCRGLDLLMSFAFGYNGVSALISVVSLFTFGLMTGGPGTMVWSWLICFFMTMVVALNFSEICSAFPAAGSVYHWTGVLAPREVAPAASYWTGLFNWLGNASGDSAFAYTFSIFMNAALVLSGYDGLSTGEQVGLAIAVLFVWDILNVLRIDELGWINDFAVLLQVGTIISLMVILFDFAPKVNSAEYVFFKYYNDTGFDSQGYVLLISLLFGLYGFVGYDASAHLAEETTHARISAPVAVLSTCVATGVCGLLLIFTFLFTMQNIQSAIDGYTGNAALQIILQCTDASTAAIFAWLLVACVFFAGFSGVTVTSRILFALFRDKAAIYSDVMSTLHPELRSPVNILIFMFFTESSLILLCLISNGGDTAFYNVTGLCTIALQIAYAIPISYNVLSYLVPEHYNYVKNTLGATPFALGQWSIPLGIIAAVWLWVTSLIFFLPTSNPITASTMNYSIVVVTAIIIIGWVNWNFNSKYYFRGPKRPEDTEDAFHLKGDIKKLVTSISAAGGSKGNDDTPRRRGPSETWRLIASEAVDNPVGQRQIRRPGGPAGAGRYTEDAGSSGSGSRSPAVVHSESV